MPDQVVDLRKLSDLTHTKVLAARVGDEAVDRPNWNRLLDRVFVGAMGRAKSFEHLNQMCPRTLRRAERPSMATITCRRSTSRYKAYLRTKRAARWSRLLGGVGCEWRFLSVARQGGCRSPGADGTPDRA